MRSGEGLEWPISDAALTDSILLVLIDGRTGYKPLLSGVFWDTENVQLEDIGRIVVIRGVERRREVNAVNGVINIIAEQMEITDPDSSVLRTRIERSGLVKLTWRF